MTSGPRNLRRSVRGAFTLVEILVVLGIMVVLFALLFIPMTSGLQMASTGRAHAAIQQSLRLAMEQVQRDLSEAVYVYPPELIWTPGGAAGPGDDTAIVNYSTVTMIPPARDASGSVLQPLRPARWSNLNLMAIRYAVHTPQVEGRNITLNGQVKFFEIPTTPWEENALALYRQQGECWWDAQLRTYTFGSRYDQDNNSATPDVFVINRAVAENAVTPRMGADITVTKTISQQNGSLSADGWVSWDDAAGAPTALTLPLTYIYGAVQFKPERVENEYATPATGAAYSLWARRGAWEGLENAGDWTLQRLLWGDPPVVNGGVLINNSEVRPRIVVWRAGFTEPILDTDLLNPTLNYTNLPEGVPPAGVTPDHDAAWSLLKLRYNSRSGEVWAGSYVEAAVADLDTATPTWTYWEEGDLAPTPTSAAVNVSAAPATYVLEPSKADPWVGTRTRGVPDTLRVWVTYAYDEDVTDAVPATQVRRDYSVVGPQPDYTQLERWEVALLPTSHDTNLELRFNPNLPPAPSTLAPDWSSFPAGTTFRPGDLVTQTGGQVYRCVITTDTTDPPSGTSANWAEAAIDNYQLHVGFIVRRNWDPDTGVEDRIAVSYSTAGMYNLKLALSEFNRYGPVVSGSVVQVPKGQVPPWRNTITYNPGDLVTSGGRVYRCTQTNVNDPPPGTPGNWFEMPPVKQAAQVVYSSQVAVPNLAR